MSAVDGRTYLRASDSEQHGNDECVMQECFQKFWSTLSLLFRFFLFEVKDPKQHTERESEREKILAFKAKKTSDM